MKAVSPGSIVIFLGVVLGNAEWILALLYYLE